MLHAMDKLAPGVASSQTLLYGVEVKFYSGRLKLTPDMETEIGNISQPAMGQASAAG